MQLDALAVDAARPDLAAAPLRAVGWRSDVRPVRDARAPQRQELHDAVVARAVVARRAAAPRRPRARDTTVGVLRVSGADGRSGQTSLAGGSAEPEIENWGAHLDLVKGGAPGGIVSSDDGIVSLTTL